MSTLNRRDIFLYVAVFLLPCLSACFATLYTGSIWEDGLITLRQAANWVDGQGLAYNPGERVHGFSSPLNVLLLALFDRFFGDHNPLNAIYAYRALSIVLLGASGIWIAVAFRWAGEKSAVWPLLAALFLSLDIKTLLFSTNGQEAAFTVFFLAMGLAGAICEKPKVRFSLLILAITGLQWNRPEGFILASGLVAGDLFRQKSEKMLDRFKEYLAVIPCSILLYLPWLLFTIFYYGSPVPNTIYAKGGSSTLGSVSAKMLTSPWDVAASALAPVNFQPDSSLFVSLFSAVPVILGCGYFFFAKRDSLGRIAAAGALASYAYLCLVDAMSHNYPWSRPFPWYYPPLSFCVAIVWSSALAKWIGAERPIPSWKKLALAPATALALSLLFLFYLNECRSTRFLQATVENGVRKPIGLWLRENVRAGETVYCECIGYIGFYSQAVILDYPGLTSRKTADIRRQKKLDFFGLLHELKPGWLVLRPNEVRGAEARGLLSDYVWIRDFATPAELSGQKERQTTSFDSYFSVFKRKTLP